MAECHPVAFQWVMEAKARGATVIHVDPRFTRTSAVSDVYLPIRAGADITFVGGLINHVLSSGKYFKEYVLAYTNAATILTEDYADTEDLDGVFSGLNREHRYYDFDTWCYQGEEELKPASGEHTDPDGQQRTRRRMRQAGRGEAHGCGGAAANPTPDTDDTLQHPRCVFQVLKRHFARYTPEMVEQVCGVARFSPRSTAGDPTGHCRHTPSSPTTAPRRAAAGSTAASGPAASTRPPAVSRGGSRTGWRRTGAGPGRRTGACCTTGRRPTLMASHGVSARRWSGGTRSTGGGPGPTCRTSSLTALPITGRRRGRPAWTLSPAPIRSSCKPTARHGCSLRRGWPTARCPPITSRRNPRSATRSTASSTTRSGRSPGTGRTGTSRAGTSPDPRCSRT